MTTRMLINATVPDELRIAIVEDGELVDLDIESARRSSIRGNIYKGVVHNVEASLAAAFINFGEHKQGFLPFDEISPSQYARRWDRDESPRITDVIKRGQEIVVQVAKDAVGEKGAALTTYLSLAGRFTVLMTESDARGVSRKIDDEDAREKARAMADKIEVPDDCGYIIRTAGMGQPKTGIQKDLNRLAEMLEKIRSSASIARAPSLLHREPDLVARTLRDLYTEDIDEVLIDSREEYEAAREYFEELMPQSVETLQHYQNPIPIFAYYHVEKQVEETFERHVPLPSGGSIVIDQTEAMVAVDVNSGKMTSERDHEDTVYKTNFEACAVIAAQLRLRDLGGIIVIDFIDMDLARNKRAVEKALRDFTRTDKAKVKMSRILSNGLCIVTRQRIRGGIQRAYRQRCTVCDGTGWSRTPESHSLSILRRVEARLAQGGVELTRVKTHPSTAEYILNHKRAELLSLEKQYQSKIIIEARLEMDRAFDDVQFLSKGEMLAEITEKLPPREERKKLLPGQKKRSRKKKKQEAQEGAPQQPQQAKEGEGSSRRRGRRSRDQERPREMPAELPPDPSGITFTGRPPPEMLAKIKAEAEARRQAREKKAPAAPVRSAEPPSSSPSSSSENESPRSETFTKEASFSPAPEVGTSPPRIDPILSDTRESGRPSFLQRLLGKSSVSPPDNEGG